MPDIVLLENPCLDGIMFVQNSNDTITKVNILGCMTADEPHRLQHLC